MKVRLDKESGFPDLGFRRKYKNTKRHILNLVNPYKSNSGYLGVVINGSGWIYCEGDKISAYNYLPNLKVYLKNTIERGK